MRMRPVSVAHRGEGPHMRRFTWLQRTGHALVIVSFLGLVITGLPLRFAYVRWAHVLIDIVGGLQSAAYIHRLCALITFGYFFGHIAHVTYMLLTRPVKKVLWGPDSMVPQPKDVRDVIQMFKWFLGMGPQPKFERYSYMEKFDYWAVFWGVAIIGGSGLMLWFPTFFAKFMPGWAFNVATIIHGDEALLATSFIFTIHFFNVHARPGKFPIDTVIFTGNATAEYMQEEHPLEYERAVREGSLEARITAPASRAVYLWSVVLGFASFGIGVIMIILVLWALLH
jgi:cytochrome b subunit of formate dehydrogenase